MSVTLLIITSKLIDDTGKDVGRKILGGGGATEKCRKIAKKTEK